MKFSTLIKFLVGTALLLNGFLVFVAIQNQAADPIGVAQFWMGTGLFLVFVIVFGGSAYFFRNSIRTFIQKIPFPWYVTFLLGCLFFAGLEEAVAVTMSNLAPFFGDPSSTATITGTTNYLKLIFTHSLFPVFLPMFIAWTYLLSKYNFTSNQIFILFGITGWIGEILFLSGAVIDLILFGFWIMIYGLMIFLPAYSLPSRPNIQNPTRKHFVLALILPYLAIIPSAILVGFIQSL